MRLTTACLAAGVLLLGAGVAHAGTVTFVEGGTNAFTGSTYGGVDDTFVLRNNAIGQTDYNYGGADFLQVGTLTGATSTSQRHAFIRFDLTSMAGQYGSIESATLRLYRNTSGASTENSNYVQLYRLADANAGWIEGSGLGGGTGSVADATWEERGSTSWAGSPGASTAGTDYLSTLLASAAYDISTTYIDLVFSDLSFLSAWIEGGTNAGFFLRTQDETTVGSRFSASSSEFSDVSKRPQLILQYTDVAVVPLPSAAWMGLVLLAGLGVAARVRGRQRSATA